MNEAIHLAAYALGNISGLIAGFILGAFVYHEFRKERRRKSK